MNATKWLCENFDEYNKGYVTIGDILEEVPAFLASIVVLGLYFYGLYRWIFTGFAAYEDPNTFVDIFTSLIMVAVAVVTTVIIIMIVRYIIITIYEKIECIKIVSCKKDDKPDNDE